MIRRAGQMVQAGSWSPGNARRLCLPILTAESAVRMGTHFRAERSKRTDEVCAFSPVLSSGLVLDDGGERVWLEAGAADEGSVNLFLAHEGGGIVRLDASAVEDAHFGGDCLAEEFCHFSADHFVRVGGHLGRRGLAGADGPNRLIGDDDGRSGLRRDAD